VIFVCTGTFIRQKQKNNFLFGHFAVCLSPGTRQSGIPRIHSFVVCLKDTRQSNHKFAVCPGPGTRQSSGQRRPSPSAPSDAFYRRVPRRAHGKEFCRVSDIQHTAKPALPSHLVAVEVLPWAAHSKAFCRVFS